MFIKSNKKAMSEVISFVLITLLIVIASSTAFFFSQNIINERVAEIDSRNIEVLFRNLDYKIKESYIFDGNSFSFPLTFRTGEFSVKDNQLIFQSLVYFQGDDYCFNGLCYFARGEFEAISLNLTSGYTFSDNFSLVPGNYRLFFKNQQNVSEIKIKIQ